MRGVRILGIALATVLAVAALRVHLALADPGFDAQHAEGLLKSDPGLVYYLTERVVEAGGGVPDDFRADPRIEHPRTVDVPATFTVGEEFLVAWLYRLTGAPLPLHTFCVWVMGLVAATTGAFVVGLVWELARSTRACALAALLYALLPANHRTIGFVLMREDLSLPLFALHLWLLARAAHRPSSLRCTAAGLAAAAALATWHAMGFVLALEAGCLVLWLLRSARTPFDPPRAWTGLVAFLAATLVVPVLAAQCAWIGPPAQIALALFVASRLPRKHGRRAVTALATWLGLASAGRLLSSGDLAHVTSAFLAKLSHLGRFPDDPSALPFDARLLWQGPFATLDLDRAWAELGMLLPLGVLAIVVAASAWGRRVDATRALLGIFALVSLAAAWFVVRLAVLPGLVLPALVALSFERLLASARASTRFATGAAVALALLVQGAAFARWTRGFEIAWYEPAVQRRELANLVAELPSVVPEGEAVAADFVNSTAVLAWTRRPIVVQPKWESAESRRRVRVFWQALYHGTPDDLRRLLVDDFDCHWLLLDRFTLWTLRASRALAGLSADVTDPPPGSALAALLMPESEDPAPGFHLVWRSPPTLRQSNGQPSDFFRLYRVDGR